MFRYPVIFLISTCLSIGSNFFERIHMAEVNQALAQIAAPKLAANSPLKRLPDKAPVHDPATCPICIALHAPVAAQLASVPSLQPIDRVGQIAPYLPTAFDPVKISAEQCRGPPAA